ncbi:hypothetical protein PybrP1_002778 [[Pythium] brassicae (nom. inval.)]|nr:hypothetical protein PybrP1_002778 [[Pythium] brassicae (nom. inval.)]
MTTSVKVDELQLGASYGRYRGWKSVVPPASEPPAASDEELPAAVEAPALGALVVQFEAQAREDLRVGFAPPRVGREPSQWVYELAIGYSGNTEVLWRKRGAAAAEAAGGARAQEQDLARVFAGRTCSPQDFVTYWAVVQQGVLVFGIGARVGVDTVAKCADPAFVAVQQVALTSWDSPATVRNLVLTPVYDAPLDVASMAPGTIVRADPSGREDLVSAQERAEFERACAAAQRRAERFGGAFVAPAIKTFLDPKTVRRLQRTGAIEPGFATGFDLSSQDEVSKREQRMKRFDTPAFALEYSTETVRALSEGVTQDEWQEKQREKEKLRERARKFGLSDAADCSGRTDLTPASRKVLQERCDVRSDSSAFRDDAVHVYSLDERFQQVRTSDVLAYFVGYGPSYVEWINDSSCTVVFQDPFTAGRALVSLGEEVPPQTKASSAAPVAAAGADDIEMDAEPEPSVDVPDDAFNRSHWRVGRAIASSSQPGHKTWRVLLRKATEDDFPPEKTNKRYHERGRGGHAPAQQRGRAPRQPQDRGSTMPSRYATSSGSRARAHPYRNADSGGNSERGAGRRRRGRRDSDDDRGGGDDDDGDSTRDTGKPSSRIRMNADGSIDFVRPGAGDVTPAAEAQPDATS